MFLYVDFFILITGFPILGVIAKGVMIRERGASRTRAEARLAPVHRSTLSRAHARPPDHLGTLLRFKTPGVLCC